MQVQFTWNQQGGILGGPDNRLMNLTYAIGSRGRNGLSDMDIRLKRDLESIDGVEYVSSHNRYAIEFRFGKLFNPDESKEAILEKIREWIEDGGMDDTDEDIEVVMVEVDKTKKTRKLTTKHYDKVKRFMQNGGQETPDSITIPDEKTLVLRARLMFEEVLETIQDGLGLDVKIMQLDPEEVRQNYGSAIIPKGAVQEGKILFIKRRPVNLVELADGCADTKVVTTGTLIAAGIPDDRLQDIVDDSNLAKGSTKDEHGKIQKPPGWKPPNIAGFLADLAPVSLPPDSGNKDPMTPAEKKFHKEDAARQEYKRSTKPGPGRE